MKELDFRNAITADAEFEGDPDLDSPEFKVKFDKVLKKIESCSELEILSLRSNWIKAKQLNPLAAVLTNHKNLKYLDLSYNSLSLRSALALKKIITEHERLRKISLDFNDFTDEFIADLIEDNTDELNQRLKSIELSLSNNELTIKSVDMTEIRLHNDSRLAMLVCNKIPREISIEYRKQIEKNTEQISSSDQPVSYPNQADTSTFFIPLKEASVASSSRGSDNLAHRKTFEESKDSAQKNRNSISPR